MIRAKPGQHGDAPRHTHTLDFQFVYVLKGWAVFEYEGYGQHRLVAGSTVYQPPGIPRMWKCLRSPCRRISRPRRSSSPFVPAPWGAILAA